MKILNISSIEGMFKIRNEDKPSCTITQGAGKDLLFRDWGDPYQDKSETWWKYLQRTMFNGNYYKTLNYVNKLFDLGFENNSVIFSNNKITKFSSVSNIPYENIREKRILKVRKRKWQKRDKEYWSQFGIPLKYLEEKNIYPIDTVFIYDTENNEKVWLIDNIAYDYPLGRKDNITHRKIYFPKGISKFNSTRFLSNNQNYFVQNLKYIPKSGDRLFIQSSYKDCNTMGQFGEYAIAPDSENLWLNPIFWEEIKKNWKKIIIFANNDWQKSENYGLMYANKHSELYNLPIVYTPSIQGVSDISDYRKICGDIKTKKLIEDVVRTVEITPPRV